MVGAAVRGLSKILRKKLKKAPVLGKYVKKDKTFLKRRATVAGVKPTVSKGDAIPEFIKKRPVTSAGIAGVALGAAQYRRKKLYEEKDRQKKKRTRVDVRRG